jgi:hypothetical protein
MRLIMCAVLMAALAAPAAAQKPKDKEKAAEPAKGSVSEADVLGRIDADAAYVMVVRPRGIKVLLEWLGKFGGLAQMSIQDVLGELGSESSRLFGVDLANPTTWSESGVDLDAPMGIGLLAIDAAAAEKAYKALTADAKRDAKKMAKVARPWYRNRLVVSVADEAKLKKLLGHMSSNSAIALVDGDAGRLAAAAGFAADGKDVAKQGAAVAKALKKAKVIAFGRLDDLYVFIRLEKGFMTLDALRAFSPETVPFDWKRDGGALLKLLDRKIAKGGAAVALTGSAGAKLVDADLGVWGEAGRFLDAGKATGWDRSLSATTGITDEAQWKTLVQEGNKEVQRCEEFRPVAQTGPFTDFAFTFRAEPNALTTSVNWGLRKGYALAAALVAADDGLVDLAAATDAVAIGVLYLNGLAPIRALPRTGAFAKPWDELMEAQYLCGWAGTQASMLFGWPMLIAAGVDSEAANDPQFKSLADNVRNGAAAFRQVSMDPSGNVGVVLASFTSTPDLDWIKGLGGKSSEVKVGQRTVTVYAPKSKWEPALLQTALGANQVAYGILFGGNAAVKWFWGKGSPKASAAAGVIGVGRADLPKILDQLGKSQPVMAPVFTELAKRMGLLTAKLAIDGDLLNGAMKLEIK